jgi:hypothetical protein
MGTWTKRGLSLLALWLAPVVGYAIIRYLGVGLWPGHKAEQGWDQWIKANFGGFTTTVLYVLMVWLVLSAVVVWTVQDYELDGGGMAAGTGLVLLAVASLVLAIVVGVRDGKDQARYYASSVTFYVPDTHSSPPSLSNLMSGAAKVAGSPCDLVDVQSDVPSCIKQGTLPTTGWDARVSSLNGADYALTHSASFKQNVNLNSDTLTYLNAWHGQPARWSGILDGTGWYTPMGGVAEWDGHKVKQCDFEGKYSINRAFDGGHMNDLKDMLAHDYSSLLYHMTDVWGYCDGDQPIVIVPMYKQVTFKQRTVDEPAGFVKIQGSPSGDPKFTYQTSAKPGEYPGAVYPASIVDEQLSSSEWAAGRRLRNRSGFGFTPATSDAQEGNVSDYLLRNKATGRLEWVTPLTLRSSSSEIFVAYAVSYADQMQSGSLNPLRIYVLNTNDSRQVNIDTLESDARNWLANLVPGFAGQGGKLLEFTPVGGNIWRAYGEINGRVEYLLDVDATNVSSSVLTNIGGSTAAGGTSGGSAPANQACGGSLTSLTQAQLATCLKLFADELAGRQGGQASPSK